MTLEEAAEAYRTAVTVRKAACDAQLRAQRAMEQAERAVERARKVVLWVAEGLGDEIESSTGNAAIDITQPGLHAS